MKLNGFKIVNYLCTSLHLGDLSVTDAVGLAGWTDGFVRLTGGPVDGLNPERPLRVLIHGKHYLITRLDHVKEELSTLFKLCITIIYSYLKNIRPTFVLKKSFIYLFYIIQK